MTPLRRTKIVATLGPATFSPEMIARLIEAGVNVFRLNFSHGHHENYRTVIATIRAISENLAVGVSILQDVQGPKIRIGEVENGGITLENGQEFTLQNEPCLATTQGASVSYPYLLDDIPLQARILLDDGKLEMVVKAKTEQTLVCEVVYGGELTPKKGVNFPGIPLRIKAVTDKDRTDILFGIEQGVDFLAVSFVQRASDIMEVKDFLSEHGSQTAVIAKIERQEALNNIEAIASLADGIMVARGDLGVEIPTEQVPLTQKNIIALCNSIGKPVITATQMLDSMITNPRPTRAEASDVANAILDGTDAIMLSNETAVGKFPLLAVGTMHNIAMTVEKELSHRLERRRDNLKIKSISQSIGLATCQIAHSLSATAIVTATHYGGTARQVSRHRPPMLIIAATPVLKTYRELNLLWGTYPLLIKPVHDTDTLMRLILDEALGHKLIQYGDTVIVTAGIPVGMSGTTNMIKVESVSKILTRGIGLGQKIVNGRAVFAHSGEEACLKVGPGDILITPMTSLEYMPIIEQVAGIITLEGGLTSHAAIVGVSLKIPVIVGAGDAMAQIRENSQITLDPTQGLIFAGIPNIT